MLGLLGDTVIGLDHLTGPTGREDVERSRLVRHETVRGAPVLQDLGDDAEERSLDFFLDETFCDVDAEIARLRRARRSRSILSLIFGADLSVGSFRIEEIKVVTRKESPTGRTVRAEMSVELVRSGGGSLTGVATSLVAALASPFVRRGR